MELIETPLACQTLYEGKIIRVERMDVRLSDGRVSKREIVRHSGGCAVVAVDAHGRIPLVEQYRMAIARTTLELPAGKVDAGEDALVCAQRELSEETGLSARRWRKLCDSLSSPGFTDEVLHIYLAQDLTAGAQHLDEGEHLHVQWVALDEAVEMALDGRLADGKTLTGLLMAQRVLAGREGA